MEGKESKTFGARLFDDSVWNEVFSSQPRPVLPPKPL